MSIFLKCKCSTQVRAARKMETPKGDRKRGLGSTDHSAESQSQVLICVSRVLKVIRKGVPQKCRGRTFTGYKITQAKQAGYKGPGQRGCIKQAKYRPQSRMALRPS